MRISALIELSKVTVLPGIGRFCSKNLSANSKMQQMVLARIVRVRVMINPLDKDTSKATLQQKMLLWNKKPVEFPLSDIDDIAVKSDVVLLARSSGPTHNGSAPCG